MLHSRHNQAVERHIKLLIETYESVFRFLKREEEICRKIKSRKLMKKFNTKRQFKSCLSVGNLYHDFAACLG